MLCVIRGFFRAPTCVFRQSRGTPHKAAAAVASLPTDDLEYAYMTGSAVQVRSLRFVVLHVRPLLNCYSFYCSFVFVVMKKGIGLSYYRGSDPLLEALARRRS